MSHGGKAICPSCLQTHGFLKLQPNAITNGPPADFATARNLEHFSNVHFKSYFSIANAAYKRTHLM